MATFHVIYDPSDRLTHRSESMQQLKISLAMLRLEEPPETQREREELIQKLVTLLVSQL